MSRDVVLLLVLAATALGAGAALDARPEAAREVRVAADAWVDPWDRTRVQVPAVLRRAEDVERRVTFRRGRGPRREASPDEELMLVLERGRVGERIDLRVDERDPRTGRRVVGRADVVVRRPTANERCDPEATTGAFPSYCAPENASQGG